MIKIDELGRKISTTVSRLLIEKLSKAYIFFVWDFLFKSLLVIFSVHYTADANNSVPGTTVTEDQL